MVFSLVISLTPLYFQKCCCFSGHQVPFTMAIENVLFSNNTLLSYFHDVLVLSNHRAV